MRFDNQNNQRSLSPVRHHSYIKAMPRPLPCSRLWRVMLGFTALALFAIFNAQAQTAEPVAPTSPSTGTPSAPAPINAYPPLAQPQIAIVSPKYAARDIDRVFDLLDANHDGKISRMEATNFKNVAKHFDQADTDKDGMLSNLEFTTAINTSLPQ